MKTLSERITATREGKKAWHQERTIFEVTERLCELLEQKGMTRTRFAKLMGTTKGYVSQLLDGECNMTLRTLSDAFLALDRSVHISDSAATLDYEMPTTLRIHGSDPEWTDTIENDASVFAWENKQRQS
jgi:transcriptional regulator with XRE-family HTH domain